MRWNELELQEEEKSAFEEKNRKWLFGEEVFLMKSMPFGKSTT